MVVARTRSDELEAAPQPAEPAPRMRHIRALDGLRGIAVLAVVLYHFAPSVAPGGFLGVDLFFVLSGFLITSLLVNEWEGTGRLALPPFWLRRARRLLPALFLVLAAVGVYAVVFLDQVDAHHVAVDGVSSLFYVANWHFIDSGQTYIQQFLQQAPSPLRHMWSLAIEEQFYLVWPILVLGVSKVVGRRAAPASRQRRRFQRALLAVCVVLGVASLLRMIGLFQSGSGPDRVYYGTDTRAFIVLIGAALAALSAGIPTVRRSLRGAVVFAGCCSAVALIVAMASVTTDSSWLYEGGYGLLAVIMVVVLVGAAQPGMNPLARLFETRPLVGLGLISYGVYLWHWPISLWITAANTGLDGFALFVVRSAVTLAVSLASYFLVEMPIRRGHFPRLPHLNRAVVPIAFIAALVALLAVPVLAFPSVESAPTVSVRAVGSALVTAGYEGAPRCDGGPAPVPIKPNRQLTVQLVGNSIAGEIKDCLGSILQARDAKLEGVNPAGFLLCDAIPSIRAQTRNRATHPQAAILFSFVAYDQRCGEPWYWPVDKLVAMWKAAGTHVYLVPSVPFAPGSPKEDVLGGGPLLEAEYYKQLADEDPAQVTLLDAGTFLRDADGVYVWRMPCVTGGEPGCDAQGTVGIRWTDGFHYCTDPAFEAHGCVGVENQAGERRASAAVAQVLIPSLEALEIPARKRSG